MKNSPISHTNERFGHYFRISPALNDAARDEVYFIRHDVYARELGFEPTRPSERETDRYDSHALHCIVRTADDEARPVGCARVVLPDPANPDQLLPFEVACKDTLDRSIIDTTALPRNRVAEVSRLAVMGEFRRRKGEAASPVNLSAKDMLGTPASRFPNIPVSLYFAAVAIAQRQGIEYLFTLTEPRLARHFAKMGLHIMPIGAPIEHRGTRVPSMLRVSEIYPNLRALMRPIWHEVHAQMETAQLVHDAVRSVADADSPEVEGPVSVWG